MIDQGLHLVDAGIRIFLIDEAQVAFEFANSFGHVLSLHEHQPVLEMGGCEPGIGLNGLVERVLGAVGVVQQHLRATANCFEFGYIACERIGNAIDGLQSAIGILLCERKSRGLNGGL